MAAPNVDGFWALLKGVLPWVLHDAAETALIEKYGDMVVAAYDQYEAGQPASIGPIPIKIATDSDTVTLVVQKH